MGNRTIRRCQKCGYETMSCEDIDVVRTHNGCGGLIKIIKINSKDALVSGEEQ